MARTGLEKADVRRARDSLIAQQLYPSVDAVRVELGNTGSKSTIHRYLKELDAEHGGPALRTAAVSEALQELVARLSTQLCAEADARAAEAVAQCEQKLGQMQAELAAALGREQDVKAALSAECAAHEASKKALQTVSIARHTAEQQVRDLRERLTENEALRRQQQQALAAKQHEAGQLNQECARLASETAHAKQSLYEQLTLRRQQEEKFEQLRAQHLHAADTERQLVGKMAEAELLAERLAAAEHALESARHRVRELDLGLEKAEARAQVHEGIGDQLRSYLDALKPPKSGEA